MTSFLSHLHTDLRRTLLTHRGATHRTEDVPTGMHKRYARMKQIPLPKPAKLGVDLQDAITHRHSSFGGNTCAPLTLQECGTLLGSLQRRPNSVNRNYPSGGALYPIETYLVSTALESQAPAVFHYNPSDHALECLWSLPEDYDLKQLAAYPESLPPSMLLVFTSVWRRSSTKYGDFTYTVALLEAGHMGENILLVGNALGLNLRPFAGFNDERIAELLDLDESEEQTVHTITVCKG